MKVETQTGTTDDLYYAHDHLFSPAVLVESDGNIVEHAKYDACEKSSTPFVILQKFVNQLFLCLRVHRIPFVSKV